MSHATVKAGFTSALSGAGYTEADNLLEFRDNETPLSYNHKHYVLKVEEFPSEMYTGDNYIQSYQFRLEVIYKNTDTTQRDTNAGLFATLLNTLRAVTDFKGEVERPSFIDEDDKQHTIGMFVFEAGTEGC